LPILRLSISHPCSIDNTGRPARESLSVKFEEENGYLGVCIATWMGILIGSHSANFIVKPAKYPVKNAAIRSLA